MQVELATGGRKKTDHLSVPVQPSSTVLNLLRRLSTFIVSSTRLTTAIATSDDQKGGTSNVIVPSSFDADDYSNGELDKVVTAWKMARADDYHPAPSLCCRHSAKITRFRYGAQRTQLFLHPLCGGSIPEVPDLKSKEV